MWYALAKDVRTRRIRLIFALLGVVIAAALGTRLWFGAVPESAAPSIMARPAAEVTATRQGVLRGPLGTLDEIDVEPQPARP